MHASARPCAIAGSALLTSGMLAVMPTVQPAGLRVDNMDVRLVDAGSLLTDVTGALGNLDPLTSLGGLSLPDLGSLDLGGLNLGGIENIPYNLFADIVNIPANEITALGTYAAALGPAGESTVADVPGLLQTVDLPVGAGGAMEPVIEGAVGPGGAWEPLGIAGTGSWYMESIGNTWGWDDGNFAQVDAISNLLVPFPAFSTAVADEVQVLTQSEIVDGAANNCEFECANVLGWFGSWFNTPLTQLLSGFSFGNIVEDTVGSNSTTGVVNIPGDTIWSPSVFGSPTTVVLNPLLPFESLADNLTGSPASNPIEMPNVETLFTNLGNVSTDFQTDFNPFETGSFLYWGAPTDYSIPAALAGFVEDFTGIPNQFINPDINPIPDIGWQPLGAEPITGYTDGPSSLLTGLPAGFEYLVQGLVGYLDPSIYLDAIENDVSGLTGALENPASLLSDIPLATFLLGDPSSLLGPLDLSSLVGSTDPGSLLGSTDLSSLLGSVDPSSLLGSFDPSTLAGDLSTLLASGAANTAITTIPDLALQLLTSF